jgi:excisionase family DNA binding protein
MLLAAIAAEMLGRGVAPGAPLDGDPAPLGYSVAEAARLLGVSDDLVRAEISRGTFVARRFGGRLVIPASEVARVVEVLREDAQP